MRSPLVALALLLPAALAAQDATPDACAVPAHAVTLRPAADTARDARAYWLSDALVQWPGRQDARLRLYHSAEAQLRAAVGAAVQGADGVIVLERDDAPLAAEVAAKTRFIGAGARYRLPADAHARLDALLREQLVLVAEDAEGRVLDATRLQLPLALDARYAAAQTQELGPKVTAVATTVALWAPTARRVELCLYDAQTAAPIDAFPMVRDEAAGTWSLGLFGDRRGMAYRFAVEVVVPGVGVVRNLVTDPYSVALTADSRHSVLLSLDDPATKPQGWDRARQPQPLRAMTDLVVYELHVRDFSIADSSVRAAWRGKYRGFTEPRSAGTAHLRALQAAGVTDVHLLPVFDFATVPEASCVSPPIPAAGPASDVQRQAVRSALGDDCYNWGYDPFHFNVPEGSYATSVADPAARIREFRAMVQALHGLGLRVGMDLVYNHTNASGQAAKSVLDRIVPGYYHRLDATGRVERSTCCDNTATEHMMMEKLMVESAALWVRHYRIDSYRFDLMGHQPRAAMERLQVAVDTAAGRRVPLIGEGWNFGEIANGARFVQASQLSLGGSGIATFSDRARDALRGGGCCDGGEALVRGQGLINGLGAAPNAMNVGRDWRNDALWAADMARIGLAGTLARYELVGADGTRKPLSRFEYAGGPAGYVQEPGEVVNYVENHDNPTLFDINALRLPRETSREERARAQVVGIAFTAFSQGVAYLHAGVEILRSKSLDKNSFESGDWFNAIDWTYRDNGFGRGLPVAGGDDDFAVMRPVLEDRGIAPTPADIRWTRDAALDLLRIRSSTPLFRLRSAAEVQRRLRFLNVGPAQVPTLIVGLLDGAGYEVPTFGEVLYAINVSDRATTVTLPEVAGRRFELHPVHRRADAADRRAREARWEQANGTLTVPARTAVVFVRP